MWRPVTSQYLPEEAPDGPTGRTWRFIGGPRLRVLPPFVKAELFELDAGRPPRPSRGVQSVVLVLKGPLRIEYSASNAVQLCSDDVASDMVGKGVISVLRPPPLHWEPVRGLNVCLDVPAELKRQAPRHRTIHAHHVSRISHDRVRTKILTGTVNDKSAVQPLTETPCIMLDIELEPGATFDWEVQPKWNAFIFTLEGIVQVNEFERVSPMTCVEFARPLLDVTPEPGDDRVKPEGDSGKIRLVGITRSRVFAAAAQPLDQPIYHQGPFVDVSVEWIQQAYDDYANRRNGFETSEKSNSSPGSMPPE